MLFDLLLSLLIGLSGWPAYAMVGLLLFACGAGGPIPQDILLLAEGSFSRAGMMEAAPLILVAWLGLFAGDALSFWIGHRWGARWVRRPWAASIVPPEQLPAAEQWAHRYAFPLCFVSRFLPGLRSTLFFVGGTLRMPWRPFLLADGTAALLHVGVLVLGARSLGWRWEHLRMPFERADDALTLVLVAAVLYLLLRRRSKPRA